MVSHARGIGSETLVLDPLWVAQDLSEPAELAVIADRQRDKAVQAGENILRLNVGMTVAAALGRGSRNEPVHCLVGEKRRLHVQHGEIDVVA